MRRRLVLGIGLAVLAAGLAAAPWLRRAPTEPVPAGRVAALNAQLHQISGPYRLLVGDSQAERLYLPTLCGEPVLNAGIAGLRAPGVRAVIAALELPRPPASTVLMVGTNDLLRRRRPEAAASQTAFRMTLGAILAELGARGGRVFAVPPPPIDAARAGAAFDAGARDRYAAIVGDECARAGCRVADIWPADAHSSPDGVHVAARDLTGPDGAASGLARAVCVP